MRSWSRLGPFARDLLRPLPEPPPPIDYGHRPRQVRNIGIGALVLDVFHQQPELTAIEIAERLQLPPQRVQRALYALTDRGHVTRERTVYRRVTA